MSKDPAGPARAPDLQALFSDPQGPLARFLGGRPRRPLSKWLHYFEIYDRHLARFRGRPVHLAEIGVAAGGSLQMWRDYLGPQAVVHGVDVDPAARAMEGEGFRIHIGDQADSEFLARLRSEIPRLDVLIDDGGHHMHQLLATFEALYPHLAADGAYLCEDLHTCYLARYGGGYRAPASFVERSKDWIDLLNAWHSEDDRLRIGEFTRSTWSMHYYDSVLVIEKRPREEPLALQVIDGRAKVGPGEIR
jgi:hypothetical protein